MIHLRKKGEGSIISFEPYEGGLMDKPACRELLFGYTCPECNNVVEALFLTDFEVPPKLYEEIRLDSTDKDGNPKYLQPGKKGTKGHRLSHYSSTMIRRGEMVSAQHIKFLDHYLRILPEGVWTPCGYVSFRSYRADIMIQDAMLFKLIDPSNFEFNEKNVPSILAKIITPVYGGKMHYKIVKEFTGSDMDMLIVHRSAAPWQITHACGEYRKST